jgi:hypothetical protein
MKGEKFVGMLDNHARVINSQARLLGRLQDAIAYLGTRESAEQAVKTAGRFSMLWVPLREVFLPGSYKKAVDAAQRALLAPQPAPAQEPKIDIKPAPEAAQAAGKAQ